MITITDDVFSASGETLPQAARKLTLAKKAQRDKDAERAKSWELQSMYAANNLLLIYDVHFAKHAPAYWMIGAPGRIPCLDKVADSIFLYGAQGKALANSDYQILDGLESSRGLIALRCLDEHGKAFYVAVGIDGDQYTTRPIPHEVGLSVWRLVQD